MNRGPLILYVPGLRPKPRPGIHRHELFRCLVEGVGRVDTDVAAQINAADRAFDVVGWTYDFYAEHRDIALDRAGIELVLRQKEPTPRDLAEATSFRRRLVRWLYHLADRLPVLIPQLADETMQLHLRDLRRYMSNESGIADAIRRLLKMPLRAAHKVQHPVLLIGHSMGSVIAYETLWQMSRDPRDEADRGLRVDLVTIGSPLGMRYIQRRLIGRGETGERRYPDNIRHWDNFAAVGEMTAIDMTVRRDFAEMISLGLVEDIRDTPVHNYYHPDGTADGTLNVHAEYGYLVNTVVAKRIAEWWRNAASLSAPAEPMLDRPGRIRLDPGSAL